MLRSRRAFEGEQDPTCGKYTGAQNTRAEMPRDNTIGRSASV